MQYYVKSEEQRIPVAVEFIKAEIELLEQDIAECNYEEDPYGRKIYSPGVYSYEKRMYENEKQRLETILYLLTTETPVSVLSL